MSEDCLSVNVIRPAGLSKATGLLPVLVWVHGGGFDSKYPMIPSRYYMFICAGQASSFSNASAIVTQSVSRVYIYPTLIQAILIISQGTPIVFASFNYRLGPLGFAPGHEIAAAGLLNLGMRDSMAAFQWIHDNIATFGGDPTKVGIEAPRNHVSGINLMVRGQVTAYGISAGSILIADLMLNPAMGDFTRAMVSISSPNIYFNLSILNCNRYLDPAPHPLLPPGPRPTANSTGTTSSEPSQNAHPRSKTLHPWTAYAQPQSPRTLSLPPSASPRPRPTSSIPGFQPSTAPAG
jgi:hypothetical protein